MTLAPGLRARAETLGQSLPPLLAEAEHLAATVILGDHGRRRAGMGDEFWQYRPAHAGRFGADDRLAPLGPVGRAFRARTRMAGGAVGDAVGRSVAVDGLHGRQGARAQGATGRGCWRWRWRCCCCAGASGWGLSGDAHPPRAGRAQIDRLALALAGEGADGLRRARCDGHGGAWAGGVPVGFPRRSGGGRGGDGAGVGPGREGRAGAGAGPGGGGVSLRRAHDL